MKRKMKVLLSTMAIGAISLFGVLGASCNAAGWVEDKIDQLMCKHEITEVIAAVDATCLEDGYSEYEVCIDCGYEVVQRKVEKARGHQTVIVKGKPATCTGMGLSDGAICEVCGEIVVEQENTRALGHNKVEVDAVAPTCTKTGLTAGVVCDNEGCGQVFVAQQVVKMTEHRYYKDVCRDCGITREEAIRTKDTSSMQQVEVQVGDVIGGGYYRLSGFGDEYTNMVTTGNDLNIGIFGGSLVLMLRGGEQHISKDSGIIIVVDWDLERNTMDIYIPENVNIVTDEGTFVIDNTTKLVSYGPSLVHQSGGLFKLVD